MQSSAVNKWIFLGLLMTLIPTIIQATPPAEFITETGWSIVREDFEYFRKYTYTATVSINGSKDNAVYTIPLSRLTGYGSYSNEYYLDGSRDNVTLSGTALTMNLTAGTHTVNLIYIAVEESLPPASNGSDTPEENETVYIVFGDDIYLLTDIVNLTLVSDLDTFPVKIFVVNEAVFMGNVKSGTVIPLPKGNYTVMSLINGEVVSQDITLTSDRTLRLVVPTVSSSSLQQQPPELRLDTAVILISVITVIGALAYGKKKKKISPDDIDWEEE